MCILKLFFLIMQINSFKLPECFKEEYVNIVQPLYLPPYWCNNHHFLEESLGVLKSNITLFKA